MDVSVALSNDDRVVGWGLVGSFGRREADAWSDVDLLVIVGDRHFAAFVDPERNTLWSTAELLVDARRNAPVGATSLATVCVRSGLPIGADWYVYPSSMGAWPRDCQVMRGPDAAARTDVPFADWNGGGRRNRPIDIDPAKQLQARLAMVPIAGKYAAHRQRTRCSCISEHLLSIAGPLPNWRLSKTSSWSWLLTARPGLCLRFRNTCVWWR